MSVPGVVGRGVEVAYGGRLALRADFDLPEGAVTALFGPNGSGKSTLLSAIAGLVPLRAGSISRGHRTVAYVLQATASSETLPITVREVVTIGRFAERGLLGRLRAKDRQAVAEALDRLEIADVADRHMSELSGGQRQRVLVAQGLAQQADLLLLDEPVTSLDLASRQRILGAVAAERAAGRTVVLSTHDLDDAEAADHVLLLAGRVVAAGPPSSVLTPDHLRAAYGGRLILDEHVHHHQTLPG